MVHDIREYYGVAMQLSEDKDLMHCLVQEGTGNTIQTSELVSHYFPYEPMKNIITNKINDEYDVCPEQLFKVRITISGTKKNIIQYEFFNVEETKEINDLFIKPDYFEGLKNFWS